MTKRDEEEIEKEEAFFGKKAIMAVVFSSISGISGCAVIIWYGVAELA